MMKKRLYYLADNFDTVDRVVQLLQRGKFGHWRLHVVSKDEVGVYKHHLHSATPLQASDLLRYGELGALVGLVIGIVIALVVIGAFGFFKNQFEIAAAVIIAMVTMHGAWIGGLAGIGNENYKIKRFHNEIESGRILLMIDLPGDKREFVQQTFSQLPLQARGADSVVALPFGDLRRHPS